MAISSWLPFDIFSRLRRLGKTKVETKSVPVAPATAQGAASVIPPFLTVCAGNGAVCVCRHMRLDEYSFDFVDQFRGLSATSLTVTVVATEPAHLQRAANVLLELRENLSNPSRGV